MEGVAMKRNHLLLKTEGLNFNRIKIDDKVLARWDNSMSAEKDEKIASIDIFDMIGSDWFGDGFTAKRMSAALRSIGEDSDVVVNINSPGGDIFEAATIYNLLAQHKGHVSVNILGLAASAASVIAMAGDSVKMSKLGFLMIHNSWSVVMGNKDDLREAADTLEQFDASILSAYTARVKLDEKKIVTMMNEETCIGADDALEFGFVDEIVEAKSGPEKNDEKKVKGQARRKIEMALAREGFSRKEREDIFLKAGVRDASEPAERDAGDEGWNQLIQTLKN
jgi:ATP-dependent Clp protease, protease subunit